MHLYQAPNHLPIRIGQDQVPERRILPLDLAEAVDGEFSPLFVDKGEAVDDGREEVGVTGFDPVGVVGDVEEVGVAAVDVVSEVAQMLAHGKHSKA